MKKYSKIIALLLCFLFIGGCNIYVYDDFDNTTPPSSNKEDSSNLSNSNIGSTIVTEGVHYTGFIDDTGVIPTERTPWNIIYDRVKTTVVTIRNIVDGDIKATGSGVFFAEDNIDNGYAYIFTNAHVVEGSESIEVLLHNDIMVNGILIGYDKNEDVAVVKITKRNDYTISKLRKSETLKIGEDILTIGSPLGEKYSLTATTGIISNLNIAITQENTNLDLYLIQIDAALNPGNSGGPLFDNAGNLIGINTIKLVKSGLNANIESFNYAIPISHFKLVSTYLLQGLKYYRPYLNITVADVRLLSAKDRNKYSIKLDHGLLVLKMGENSPLKDKVQNNQLITHIENIKIYKSSDFSVELIKHVPYDITNPDGSTIKNTITLTVCDPDGSNSKDIEITLIKR